VLRNEKGVSLVEVMIALTVFLLVFMALLQSALLSVDYNMHNILRDEAIKIAAMRVEDTRSLLFDDVTDVVLNDPGNAKNPFYNPTNPATAVSLATCGNPPVGDADYPIGVLRNFRNIQNFPYGTQVTVTDIDADTKQIQVLVRWQYKNECYTHSVISVRRR
jgi:hypothetical protein